MSDIYYSSNEELFNDEEVDLTQYEEDWAQEEMDPTAKVDKRK